jgi:hypothetical protein
MLTAAIADTAHSATGHGGHYRHRHGHPGTTLTNTITCTTLSMKIANADTMTTAAANGAISTVM